MSNPMDVYTSNSDLRLLTVDGGFAAAREAGSILTVGDRRLWRDKKNSAVVFVLAALANNSAPVNAEHVMHAIKELVSVTNWMTFIHIEDPGEGTLEEQQMHTSRRALNLLVKLLAKARRA